jgi:hypothetical protein
MQVGRRARVTSLSRKSHSDRSGYLERDGLLVRRLNVAWEPDLGALWELRFEDGAVEVFAESEIQQLRADGTLEESEIAALQESWGEAPRTTSYPFRKLGGGSSAATAILAFAVFAIAGVLLIGVGIAQTSIVLGSLGALAILIGAGAAVALVS